MRFVELASTENKINNNEALSNEMLSEHKPLHCETYICLAARCNWYKYGPEYQEYE